MRIFISCGHNNARNYIKDEHGKWRLSIYKDKGAAGGGMTEYGVTQKIADELRKTYNETTENVNLVFVPEGINLTDRIKWINKYSVDGDMCIELHLDSFTSPIVEGCSTWYMSGSKWAEEKAKVFQREYTRVTGIKGRGVYGDLRNRNGRLGFVRDTKIPAFLLEMGFITNEADRKRIIEKGAEALSLALDLITPFK